MTSKVTYLGNLRTESVHLQSASKMITDAPVDNHGKGEAFSPTDTVATALATCMITVMGIKANSMDVDIKGVTAEVTKIMSSSPRMISEIIVKVEFPMTFAEKTRKILVNTGMNCPVLLSLHPDIKKDISFNYA